MIKAFTIGLGVAAALMLLFYPEIKGWRQGSQRIVQVPESDARRFDRQARAAQDVTASEEEEEERPIRRKSRDARREPIMYRDPVRGLRQLTEADRREREDEIRRDEEISATKNYQPPDHWKWKYQDEQGCPPEPWLPCPPHVFERPVGDLRPVPVTRHSRSRPLPPPCYGGCPYDGE